MTIGKRIVLGFTLAVAISAAQGFYGYSHLASLSDNARVVVMDCLPGTYLAGQFEATVQENRSLVLSHRLAQDESQRRDIEKRMSEVKAEVDRVSNEYESTITKDEDRKLFDTLNSSSNPVLPTSLSSVAVEVAGPLTRAMRCTVERPSLVSWKLLKLPIAG